MNGGSGDADEDGSRLACKQPRDRPESAPGPAGYPRNRTGRPRSGELAGVPAPELSTGRGAGATAVAETAAGAARFARLVDTIAEAPDDCSP